MSELNIKDPEVKSYCEKFKIEEILNESINNTLYSLPADPYSSICSILKTYSSNSFTTDSIILKEQFNSDFTKTLTLLITLSYKGNTRQIYSYPIPYSDKEKEKVENSPNELLELFNKYFEKSLENYSFENIEDFDSNLMEIFSKIPKEEREPCKLLVNSLSISVFISMSLMCDKTFISFINDSFPNYIFKSDKIPNLGFSIFKTGKTMNSKVKFERFMLIIKNENNLDQPTLIDIINKIYAALRKVLTAGKAGENGMRLNNEGSFFPPSDNLNDILKLLENVINEVNMPDTISIGIDCNANNYYVEADKTYEMDGFKKNPDSSQLMEFYIKLLTDHPLIEYLEEPFYKDDEESLFKFIAQLKTDKPKVLVVSKTTTQPNIVEVEENHTTEPVNKNHGELKLDFSDTSLDKPSATEQPKKVENDEEPSKSYYQSLRIGTIMTFSELLKLKEQLSSEEDEEPNEGNETPAADYGLILWDCDVETKQSCIIDIALGLNIKYVFLNGITMREEKLCKIKQYIEGVKQLYSE